MSSCIITELRPIDLSLAESKPNLIAVSPTVSIQTALDKMSKSKITSLPIFSHNDTEVVSIVNLFDILLYLVSDSEKNKLTDSVENVLGLDSNRESYRIRKVDHKDKLFETLQGFASGCHRVLVVNNANTKQKPWMLSQTDIIRHVMNHPDSVSGLLDLEKPVGDLDLNPGDKKLVTAKDTDIALKVYRVMAAENLSGLPIIDANDNFVGDLCVEDLPIAISEAIKELQLPCKDYIQLTSKHIVPSSATCADTVKSIMSKMLKEDTHRVWILESSDSKRVIGVVTMSDIMKHLSSNPPTSIF